MESQSPLVIEKERTALVVIDLQKGIVARPSAPYASDAVVKNASAIAEAFRKNGMPVFLVRVTPSPDGKDASSRHGGTLHDEGGVE